MLQLRPMAVLLSIAVLATFGCNGGGGGGGATPTGSGTTGGAKATGTFGTAVISGKVTFEGTPPPPATVNMDADPFCSAQHEGGAKRSNYVVGPGKGLKWVFVHVKEGVGGTYGAPGEPVVLDQKGCEYEPHVFGIMAGQTLKILNSDDTLHNIHSLPKQSRPFNSAMPKAGMVLEKTFQRPEVMVRVKCDVHPWMETWAGVLSHPFHGVSGDDGSFSIGRLPAGTYTIEAWHEKGGSQTQTVTVGDGETKQINFSFKAS